MRRILPLIFLLAVSSFGYIRLTTSGTPPVPIQRVDNTGIQFYLNSLIVAGATNSQTGGGSMTVISANSNPVVAARAAIATWNAVSTANVNFLPLKITQTPNIQHAEDGLMVVTIAYAADDVSAVGQALAFTVNEYAAATGTNPYVPGQTVVNGDILDSDILLNPAVQFSTDGSTSFDLQAVLTHEFGHALSANHTGVLGATMFQAPTPGTIARILSADDLSFVNSVYPAPSGAQTFGTISGTVTLSGSPVPYALLSFTDPAQGINIGGLAAANGTYSIQVPPGSYTTYAEPFGSVVQPGNLYFTVTQAAQTTTFQSTLLASPVVVAANSTTSASVAVAPGSTNITSLFYAFGGAGKTGDFSGILHSIVGPVLIPSGQSLDLLLTSPGMTSLTGLSIALTGKGIAVGAPRLDTTTLTGGQPIFRVTLTLASLTAPAPSNLFITQGSNTLSHTGAFVIVPPTPVISAAGLVSAVSDLTGVVGSGTVSPGEYVTLYGSGVAPATGPYAGIGYTNTGYVLGYLPQNLGGTSVTFNGVQAPVFFTGGGTQVNLQVPFEIANHQTAQVIASFGGSASAPITVPVVAQHPALFTFPANTNAYTANQDGSINTSTNAAARGSYITVVGTGIGLPSYTGIPYPIQTGGPAPAPPTADLNANGYTCTIGGVTAPVAFTGWYTGFAAEAEWIVQIPASLSATGAVPIQFSTGGVSTQSDLTVFIK